MSLGQFRNDIFCLGRAPVLRYYKMLLLSLMCVTGVTQLFIYTAVMKHRVINLLEVEEQNTGTQVVCLNQEELLCPLVSKCQSHNFHQ